jgi:hypothetical protein
VLSSEFPYSKESGNAAENAAKAILETRGSAPRLYRNTLVFLAADKVRLQDLDDAIAKYLAWSSILEEREALDLPPHQVRQAETQQHASDGAVVARLPETYQWVLAPEQRKPQSPVEWVASRLPGGDAPLAARASKKLRGEETYLTSIGSTMLRKHMDEVPLWRGDHVAVKQIVDDFARYLYLSRVAGPEVVTQAMRDGVALLTWQPDTFGYAESYDEAAGRYRGLRSGQVINISADDAGLLVKPDVAQRQLEAEVAAARGGDARGSNGVDAGEPGVQTGTADDRRRADSDGRPRRFHASVSLDPARVGRDASRIAEEVISHLAGLVGAEVRVTLEIEAEMPSGAPEQVVRTVTENGRTLKFASQGFERD